MRQKVQRLTPVLDYNFNSHVRIINDVLFPGNGKNTSQPHTYALAINAFW
jgi:hypothetical protein